jgi:hypothetical protein
MELQRHDEYMIDIVKVLKFHEIYFLEIFHLNENIKNVLYL